MSRGHPYSRYDNGPNERRPRFGPSDSRRESSFKWQSRISGSDFTTFTYDDIPEYCHQEVGLGKFTDFSAIDKDTVLVRDTRHYEDRTSKMPAKTVQTTTPVSTTSNITSNITPLSVNIPSSRPPAQKSNSLLSSFHQTPTSYPKNTYNQPSTYIDDVPPPPPPPPPNRQPPVRVEPQPMRTSVGTPTITSHNVVTTTALVTQVSTIKTLPSFNLRVPPAVTPAKDDVYQPKVEAVSPSNSENEVEKSGSEQTPNEELLKQMEKVDKEIAEVEKKISNLKERQKVLEEELSQEVIEEDVQAATEQVVEEPPSPSPAMNENQVEEEVTKPANPILTIAQQKEKSLIERIYAENRKKAEAAHAKFAKIGIPFPNALPLYNQPSDLPFYEENRKKAKAVQLKLIKYFQRKRKEKSIKQQVLMEEYQMLEKKWLEKVEKWENNPKRKNRELRFRDFYEKVFPEIKRQREQTERFSRLGSRANWGLAARSEAEYNEILKDLTEKESHEKHMRDLAVEPPPLLDEDQKRVKFINRNGLIKDLRVYVDQRKMLNVWTDKEKEIFKEKYIECPKGFDYIAKFLDNKSVKDCVLYYYRTKRTGNYKKLAKKQSLKRKRLPNSNLTPKEDNPKPKILKPSSTAVPTSTVTTTVVVAHNITADMEHSEHSDIEDDELYDGHSDESESSALIPSSSGITMKLSQQTNKSEPVETPRWSKNEREIAIEGLRRHGRNWAAIAEMVVTKTYAQCKNFYFNYKKKLNLESVVAKHNSSKLQRQESEETISASEISDDETAISCKTNQGMVRETRSQTAEKRDTIDLQSEESQQVIMINSGEDVNPGMLQEQGNPEKDGIEGTSDLAVAEMVENTCLDEVPIVVDDNKHNVKHFNVTSTADEVTSVPMTMHSPHIVDNTVTRVTNQSSHPSPVLATIQASNTQHSTTRTNIATTTTMSTTMFPSNHAFRTIVVDTPRDPPSSHTEALLDMTRRTVPVARNDTKTKSCDEEREKAKKMPRFPDPQLPKVEQNEAIRTFNRFSPCIPPDTRGQLQVRTQSFPPFHPNNPAFPGHMTSHGPWLPPEMYSLVPGYPLMECFPPASMEAEMARNPALAARVMEEASAHAMWQHFEGRGLPFGHLSPYMVNPDINRLASPDGLIRRRKLQETNVTMAPTRCRSVETAVKRVPTPDYLSSNNVEARSTSQQRSVSLSDVHSMVKNVSDECNIPSLQISPEEQVCSADKVKSYEPFNVLINAAAGAKHIKEVTDKIPFTRQSCVVTNTSVIQTNDSVRYGITTGLVRKPPPLMPISGQQRSPEISEASPVVSTIRKPVQPSLEYVQSRAELSAPRSSTNVIASQTYPPPLVRSNQSIERQSTIPVKKCGCPLTNEPCKHQLYSREVPYVHRSDILQTSSHDRGRHMAQQVDSGSNRELFRPWLEKDMATMDIRSKPIRINPPDTTDLNRKMSLTTHPMSCQPITSSEVTRQSMANIAHHSRSSTSFASGSSHNRIAAMSNVSRQNMTLSSNPSNSTRHPLMESKFHQSTPVKTTNPQAQSWKNTVQNNPMFDLLQVQHQLPAQYPGFMPYPLFQLGMPHNTNVMQQEFARMAFPENMPSLRGTYPGVYHPRPSPQTSMLLGRNQSGQYPGSSKDNVSFEKKTMNEEENRSNDDVVIIEDETGVGCEEITSNDEETLSCESDGNEETWNEQMEERTKRKEALYEEEMKSNTLYDQCTIQSVDIKPILSPVQAMVVTRSSTMTYEKSPEYPETGGRTWSSSECSDINDHKTNAGIVASASGGTCGGDSSSLASTVGYGLEGSDGRIVTTQSESSGREEAHSVVLDDISDDEQHGGTMVTYGTQSNVNQSAVSSNGSLVERGIDQYGSSDTTSDRYGDSAGNMVDDTTAESSGVTRRDRYGSPSTNYTTEDISDNENTEVDDDGSSDDDRGDGGGCMVGTSSTSADERRSNICSNREVDEITTSDSYMISDDPHQIIDYDDQVTGSEDRLVTGNNSNADTSCSQSDVVPQRSMINQSENDRSDNETINDHSIRNMSGDHSGGLRNDQVVSSGNNQSLTDGNTSSNDNGIKADNSDHVVSTIHDEDTSGEHSTTTEVGVLEHDSENIVSSGNDDQLSSVVSGSYHDGGHYSSPMVSSGTLTSDDAITSRDDISVGTGNDQLATSDGDLVTGTDDVHDGSDRMVSDSTDMVSSGDGREATSSSGISVVVRLPAAVSDTPSEREDLVSSGGDARISGDMIGEATLSSNVSGLDNAEDNEAVSYLENSELTMWDNDGKRDHEVSHGFNVDTAMYSGYLPEYRVSSSSNMECRDTRGDGGITREPDMVTGTNDRVDTAGDQGPQVSHVDNEMVKSSNDAVGMIHYHGDQGDVNHGTSETTSNQEPDSQCFPVGGSSDEEDTEVSTGVTAAHEDQGDGVDTTGSMVDSDRSSVGTSMVVGSPERFVRNDEQCIVSSAGHTQPHLIHYVSGTCTNHYTSVSSSWEDVVSNSNHSPPSPIPSSSTNHQYLVSSNFSGNSSNIVSSIDDAGEGEYSGASIISDGVSSNNGEQQDTVSTENISENLHGEVSSNINDSQDAVSVSQNSQVSSNISESPHSVCVDENISENLQDGVSSNIDENVDGVSSFNSVGISPILQHGTSSIDVGNQHGVSSNNEDDVTMCESDGQPYESTYITQSSDRVISNDSENYDCTSSDVCVPDISEKYGHRITDNSENTDGVSSQSSAADNIINNDSSENIVSSNIFERNIDMSPEDSLISANSSSNQDISKNNSDISSNNALGNRQTIYSNISENQEHSSSYGSENDVSSNMVENNEQITANNVQSNEGVYGDISESSDDVFQGSSQSDLVSTSENHTEERMVDSMSDVPEWSDDHHHGAVNNQYSGTDDSEMVDRTTNDQSELSSDIKTTEKDTSNETDYYYRTDEDESGPVGIHENKKESDEDQSGLGGIYGDQSGSNEIYEDGSGLSGINEDGSEPGGIYEDQNELGGIYGDESGLSGIHENEMGHTETNEDESGLSEIHGGENEQSADNENLSTVDSSTTISNIPSGDQELMVQLGVIGDSEDTSHHVTSSLPEKYDVTVEAISSDEESDLEEGEIAETPGQPHDVTDDVVADDVTGYIPISPAASTEDSEPVFLQWEQHHVNAININSEPRIASHLPNSVPFPYAALNLNSRPNSTMSSPVAMATRSGCSTPVLYHSRDSNTPLSEHYEPLSDDENETNRDDS